MINPDWPRWITASFAQHFNVVANAGNLPFFLEGDQPGTVRTVPDYVEFRLNGPFISEPSRNYYKLLVEVSMLIVSRDDDKDVYKAQKSAGLMSAGCTRNITIFQYDIGVINPDVLTCFTLTEVQGKSIVIGQLGLVNANMAQREFIVNAPYYASIITP